MKSWTIKSKLRFRFSTKWPLWLPAHKSSVGETHLCAEGQSCTSNKFHLASNLRTGVIYICDFHFVSLWMPESLILGMLWRKRNQSLSFFSSQGTRCSHPLFLPAASPSRPALLSRMWLVCTVLAKGFDLSLLPACSCPRSLAGSGLGHSANLGWRNGQPSAAQSAVMESLLKIDGKSLPWGSRASLV